MEIQHGLGRTDLSIGAFEQVIANDPSFAPAYAGLAAAYAVRSGQTPYDRADEMSRMRAAAEKAIQLDPLSAEAHDALGIVHSRDAQWELAEKSFRRGLELDPNRSLSRIHFSMFFLLPLNRIEEAVTQARMAEKTDPLSPDVHATLAYALTSARRFDEAAAHSQKLPSRGNQCLGRAS